MSRIGAFYAGKGTLDVSMAWSIYMAMQQGERLKSERLTVKVNLLGTPCLWCWEIVDAQDGTLLESSWASLWTAYDSSHEAWQAGILRLAELTRRSRGALVQGRRTQSADQIISSAQ